MDEKKTETAESSVSPIAEAEAESHTSEDTSEAILPVEPELEPLPANEKTKRVGKQFKKNPFSKRTSKR